jgi:hypothetical protein
MGGLVPTRMRGSGYNTSGNSRYRISNTYGTSIFMGDLVRISAGTIVEASATSKDNIGAFMGCYYVDPTTKRPTWSKYWPASTSSADSTPYAFVADNPATIFEIQANSSVTTADIQVTNFDVSVGSGSTLTGMSGMRLDVGTDGATGQLRIVGIKDTPGNATAANPQVLVRIVENIDAFVSAPVS